MTASTPIELAHDIGSAGVLSIRTRHGSVRLRAVDGTSVRIHGDGDLGSSAQLDKGEGSLAISTGVDHLPGEGRRRSLDLVIDVPTRATVVVESASGKIVVDGLLGEQRYRTASGDVRLRDVAGRLTIEAVSGDVEATIVEHAVLNARTVSGDLSLRAATIGSLRASTTSGDLRIAGRLVGPGPFAIETVSGDSLLALAGDVQVEMRSITGDLRSEVEGRTEGGRGRRSIAIGTGGPTLQVRSTSGDVRVVRPSAVIRPGKRSLPVDVAGSAAVAVTTVQDDSDAVEAARLAILRSLEHGDVDIDEATRQLDALDDADALVELEEPTDDADPMPAAKEPTDA